MTDPSLITLDDGTATVRILPEAGGAIASYTSILRDERFDWLRPASEKALALRDAGEMACFPLFPYSNRIRNGAFSYEGSDIRLPVSVADPHFEHGHGWRNRWSAAETGPTRTLLVYTHEPDAWPWRYNAEQEFELENGALHVTLRLRNMSDTPMPAGFGLHPYFPSSDTTRIEASVAGMWEVDSEVLPTRHVPLTEGMTSRLIQKMNFDNVFTGWNRRARILWPEEKRYLDLMAEGPLDFLVLYTPPGEDHFCAEPVSNCTDAFNTPDEDTGRLVLGPGEGVTAKVSLVPNAFGR